MELQLFSSRFTSASERARSFAQELILETLPTEIIFTVKLNQSYDGNPLHEDEIVFSEDNGREVVCHSREEVVALLWRDSAVPEWVDISVYFTDGEKTFIEVLCCGRFTHNERLLYHEREKNPPFHVTGPAIPPGGTQPGEKFSLFWFLDLSVEKLASFAYPERVTSLRLHGVGADSEVLDALHKFSKLQYLSLKDTTFTNEDVAWLASQLPKLRIDLKKETI